MWTSREKPNVPQLCLFWAPCAASRGAAASRPGPRSSGLPPRMPRRDAPHARPRTSLHRAPFRAAASDEADRPEPMRGPGPACERFVERRRNWPGRRASPPWMEARRTGAAPPLRRIVRTSALRQTFADLAPLPDDGLADHGLGDGPLLRRTARPRRDGGVVPLAAAGMSCLPRRFGATRTLPSPAGRWGARCGGRRALAPAPRSGGASRGRADPRSAPGRACRSRISRRRRSGREGRGPAPRATRSRRGDCLGALAGTGEWGAAPSGARRALRPGRGMGRGAPCDWPVVAAGRRTGTCRRARCPAGWARAGPRPRLPSFQSVPRRTPTAASRRWRAVPPCGARWSGRGAGICGPRSRRVRPPSGRGPPPRFPEWHVGRHPRFARSASWRTRARPRRGGGGAPAAAPVRAGNRTQQQAGQAQPPWRAARPDGPKWIPHSVLARPRHRPPRGSSPGAQGEVQGAQPMEG